MTDPNMPGVHTDLGPILHDTKLVAYEVVKAARDAGHPLFFVWGIGGSGDHKNGIAIDFMVYGDGTVAHPGGPRLDVGNWVADYLWANRKRLGVRYTIFNRRIRSTTGTPPNVWLAYHGTPDPHTNHVHMSRLQSGRPAYQPPAVVKGLTPYWLSLLLEARKKDMHAAVTVVTHAETTNTVEKALRKWGYAGHLVVDGHYGTSTDEAVKWFQAKVSPGVKPDGVLGEKEWARLAGGPDGKDLFVPELGDYKKWI